MTSTVLTGRHVLVTGAAGTIGAAVVELFAQSGATVLACDLHPADGIARCDVTDEDEVRALAAGRGLTDVVHAAGVVTTGSVAGVPIRTVEQVIKVNLLSVFVLGRVLLPVLPPGGSMTVIASQAARHGAAQWSAYSASKAGVVSFVQSAAKEVGPRGVRVNAVNPGSVDGPMMRHVAQRVADVQDLPPAEVLDRYARANPMGGLIPAVDVARACLFLASPQARSVNGAALDVDGGEAPG